MDDLSMQAWITGQLTSSVTGFTLDSVSKPYTPTTYRNAFVQRVRAARTLAEKNPLEMAQLLGVPKDTYHRYETRTLLPHHLLETFCKLTGQDLTWLITGRHQRSNPSADTQSARKLA
jgi:hypothetical protein